MRTRKLTLDICDYNNNVLCNLYDNQSDISGQATDVFIIYERNGWKELTFKIPSTCEGDEGKERNYRLDFLIADYRIRAVDDSGEPDWFLISEPKITHDAFSTDVEVRAGHISQLLKTKAMDLEFSDEEGNNVGTASELLTTILEGTGWTVGHVEDFTEIDGSIKRRSLNEPIKTGALKMIEDLCDLFEAKPVYNGNKTIDILPMNPFSKTEDGEIPADLDDTKVIELHYDRNVHALSRTANTDNIVTKMYAYGAYGDATLGMCSIQTCEHKEYIITVDSDYPAGTEFRFSADGATYYFTAEDMITPSTNLIWSKLDFTSQTYVWNEETCVAYHTYKSPHEHSWPEDITVTEKQVQNYFPALFNFNYYDEVGLFTNDMLQQVAQYQRDMPTLYEISVQAATAYNNKLSDLSETGESNTGFLKLDISRYETDNSDSSNMGLLRLVINKNVYPTGVIYRSDYLEARKNYFQWYTAQELKPNGMPVPNTGSVVFIVHDTTPATYDMAYVKVIYDENGNYYKNSEGKPGTFNYREHEEDPAKITLWTKSGNFTYDSNDRFYLFCTNSMSGQLGEKMTELETLVDSVSESTKEATKENTIYHKLIFSDTREPMPSTGIASTNYGWCYRYNVTEQTEDRSQAETSNLLKLAKQEAFEPYKPEDYVGNVNLMDRVIVPKQRFINAGYEDFNETYETLYSIAYTYTTDTMLYRVSATPIKADGSVMNEASFKDYIDSLQTADFDNIMNVDTNKLILRISVCPEIPPDTDPYIAMRIRAEWARKEAYWDFELGLLQKEWDRVRVANNFFGEADVMDPYSIFSGETDKATAYAPFEPDDYEGNVDLMDAVIIPKSKFIEAGYTEFDNDYASLYTHATTIDDKIITYTCIKADGTVVPKSTMRAYLLEAAGYADIYAHDPDNLILKVYVVQSPETMEEAVVHENAWAENTSDLQNTWDLVRLANNFFGEADTVDPYDVFETYYAGSYDTYTTITGDLYLCWGEKGENSWHKVYVTEETPVVENGSYWVKRKSGNIYHGESGSWVELDTVAERNCAKGTTVVYHKCNEWDMIHHGLYEEYVHTHDGILYAGNYAFKNEFDFYYVFTTDVNSPAEHSIILDTQKLRVWPDDDVDHLTTAAIRQYDAITFLSANDVKIDAYARGDLNASGVYVTNDNKVVSNVTRVYENVLYDVNMPVGSAFFYNQRSKFLYSISITAQTTSFTPDTDAYYVRFTSNTMPTQSNYIHVHDYQNKIYIGTKMYTVLNNTGNKDRLGLYPLTEKYAELADDAYENLLSALMTAQETIKTQTNNLTDLLGDLLRETTWQDDSYVEDDEPKLYHDAMDNLEEVGKPEYDYSFTFIDLYGANKDMDYETDGNEPEWPDITIDYAAHLVDPEINVNKWAYIDKLEKCFDKEWKTKLDVNTKLTLIGQHSFTDLLARIAEVANETKSKQSLYKRAAYLTSAGYLATQKLDGAISVAKNTILGGSCSWYTDDRGRIVFEAADGNSAMMLSGAGLLISASKDEYGDWEWKSALTGTGLVADQVAAAFISAKEALIGCITTDMISAAVGNELEISSNKALLLYATADGERPAGSLKTTDSIIEIAAGTIENPAHIDIKSGGEINLLAGTDEAGGKLNIESKGELNLKSGSDMNVEGGNISIYSGGSFYIQTDNVNGRFVVASPNFSVNEDGTVNLTGGVYAKWGGIAGFTIGEHVTSGEVDYRYFYSGTDSISSTTNGIYIGTNGMNIGGGKFVYNVNQNKIVLDADHVYVGNKTINTVLDDMVATYRCSSSQIVLENYHIGDIWVCTDVNDLNQYLCIGTRQGAGSLDDWVVVSSAIRGASMDVNAENGTIALNAQNDVTITAGGKINIASGQQVSIVTLGTIKLGRASMPFTIGATDTTSDKRAYIYNGPSSIGAETNGAYYGTDGLYIRGTKNNVVSYIKATKAGDVDISGKITTTEGFIGSWTITSTSIQNASDNTATVGIANETGTNVVFWAGGTKSAAPFRVTAAGKLHATEASVSGTLTAGAGSQVGGWYIGDNYIGNLSTLNASTAGFGYDTNWANTDYVLWVGGARSGTPKFSVARSGAIYSSSGEIAGWSVASTELTGNKTGLAKTTADTDVAFWAGNTNKSSAPFRVTQAGKLYATGAEISGNITLGGSNNTSGTLTIKNASGTTIGTWNNAGINAQAGQIAGWTIGANKLSASNNYVGVGNGTDTSGVVFWAGSSNYTSAPFYVGTTGWMEAMSGRIGGWDFRTVTENNGTTKRLFSGEDTTYVALDSGTTNEEYAIWAGKVSSSEAPFRVSRTGVVYAKDFVITKEGGSTGPVDITSYPLWKTTSLNVKSASVSGNTLTISQYSGGDLVINFNSGAGAIIASVAKNGDDSYDAANVMYTVHTRATIKNSEGTVIDTHDENLTVSAATAYDSGWAGSYGAIGLSQTSSTAGYGQTITVYATGKETSSSASANITSKKFTYTVPADRYWTGYNACAGTVGIDGTNKTLDYGEVLTLHGTYTNQGGQTTTRGTRTITGPADRYETGWSGCYGTVGLNSTSATTLAYGASVTVYAQAKSTSSASSKTNVASRTITAPADNKQTGWDAAVGKLRYPGSGTSASMSITVPGSTYNTSGGVTYTVSVNDSYAFIKNSGGTTVARVTNTAYANGVADGEAKFTLSSVTLQGARTQITPITANSLRLGTQGVYYNKGTGLSTRNDMYWIGESQRGTLLGTKASTYYQGKLYDQYGSLKGDGNWYLTSSSLYAAGSVITYITSWVKPTYSVYIPDAADGIHYLIGTSVTARPVVSSGGTMYYTAGTPTYYYQAGSTVTNTYYKKTS